MTRDEMIEKLTRVRAFCDLMHSYAGRGLIEYADEEDIRHTAACRADECTDLLAALRAPAAGAPPAPAPSMPEPSPARAGYPYTDAGDAVMAQRFPAPVAPPAAAPAVEGAQDEACLTCGMPRSMSKEPEAHQWPSTVSAQANVCPGCGSMDRSFRRIRNRKVCRDVWHDSAPPIAPGSTPAPPAVAEGDAPPEDRRDV